MKLSKINQIIKLTQRVKTLERLLCPDGHTFIKQGSESYDGTGNGDESFRYVGYCKVCHKEMKVE